MNIEILYSEQSDFIDVDTITSVAFVAVGESKAVTITRPSLSSNSISNDFEPELYWAPGQISSLGLPITEGVISPESWQYLKENYG